MARNTNRQGANFELQVMHDLEERGYECLRSSGSRGKVDVVAVVNYDWWPKDEADASNLLFIQCKITNPIIPPAERVALIALALRGAALPIVAFKTKDETTGRVRPHYRILTGPGPKEWESWTPGEDTK